MGPGGSLNSQALLLLQFYMGYSDSYKTLLIDFMQQLELGSDYRLLVRLDKRSNSEIIFSKIFEFFGQEFLMVNQFYWARKRRFQI